MAMSEAVTRGNGYAGTSPTSPASPSSFWSLFGSSACCKRNDADATGADAEELPSQDFGSGCKQVQEDANTALIATLPTYDRQDSADSNSSVTPVHFRDRGLADVMVVHRATMRFKEGVRISDGPTQDDRDRGVHVENIYDFYDPEARKVRIRKMDETVVHTRRQSLKSAEELTNQLEQLNAQTAENVMKAKSMNRQMSASEVSDADSESSAESGGSNKSTRSQGEHELRKQALNKLRRQKSVVDTEATANWGHIIGKVLHRKVLDFNAVKEKAIRKRRFEAEVRSPNSTRMPLWLSRLQGRCKAIVAQVWELSKRQAKASVDVIDHEWDDPQLLTHLFSTEYLDTLMLLANASCKLIASQPPLIAANPPCRVFGDLHGQLRDLLLFFHAFGMPGRDSTSFIFNGDFVDRGRHQLELIGLLLALKVLYPEKVWLIRGNHEDRLMNEKYGFKSECMRLLGDFGPKMFELIQNVFDRLPLACLVGNRALIVHGGIGSGKWSLSDLWNIQRPLTSENLLAEENSWIFNLLWSDPIEDGKASDPTVFGVHQSPRGGVAAEFAWNITKTFCARNGLGLVIRSHQSKKGSRGFDVMHSNMLMRVFSARDYEGHGNDSAVLLITKRTVCFDDGGEGDAQGEDLLVVRAQVLRSVMKARA